VDQQTRNSTSNRWARGTAFRRVVPPRWPFAFRGLIPVIGLILVALFGMTRFANTWIENQVRTNVASALVAAGHDWTDLQVSGQQASLSGRLPAASAGDAAIQVAREATCPTWLGPRVCAISVQGDFESAGSSAVSEVVSAPPAPSAETQAAEAAAACDETLAGLMAEGGIEFASGSSAIANSSGPLLDRIAEVAGGCAGIVRVEGHTDSTGDAAANQELSAARAAAVRAALGARGLSVDRIVAAGFGASTPIATNDTPAGRARNRRIEFRVQPGTN